MKTNREKNIEKSKLVHALRGIRIEGIEGISAEDFAKYSGHVVYAGFAESFASYVEEKAHGEISPEEYISLYVETMKKALEHAHRDENMTHGQLMRAYDYFDSLIATVAKRTLGNQMGESYALDVKSAFHEKYDFIDLYDAHKREVA